MDKPVDDELFGRFSAIVGAAHALSGADAAPFSTEPRGRYGGKAAFVLRPASVDEVSAILRLATETGTPIVPQGGNTGLVGGQMPDATGREVVLSLSRLNGIREIDLQSNTVTAEAGVILHNLREAADAKDRLFPLALASQGSCQIVQHLAGRQHHL